MVYYGTDLTAAWHLIAMYLIGTLFTYEQARKCLNLQAACIAMCLLPVFQLSGVFVQYLALYLILPYFIFSFAFAPQAKFSGIGRKLEPSYGIYLYGFFCAAGGISAGDIRRQFYICAGVNSQCASDTPRSGAVFLPGGEAGAEVQPVSAAKALKVELRMSGSRSVWQY